MGHPWVSLPVATSNSDSRPLERTTASSLPSAEKLADRMSALARSLFGGVRREGEGHQNCQAHKPRQTTAPRMAARRIQAVTSVPCRAPACAEHLRAEA